MRKITKISLTFVASFFIALQLTAMAVTAQQGSGLRIIPPRQELRIERGDSATFDIDLINLSDQPVIAKAEVNDFSSDGVTGEPKINTDTSERSDRSIADLIVNLDDVALEGEESKKVTLTASIPETAPAGAYYGLVRYQPVPVDDNGEEDTGVQFTVNSSVGLLVLIEVPGDFTEAAELDSITAQNVELDEDGRPVINEDGEENILSSGSIFTSTPNRIAIKVDNTGDSFVRPFGQVVIKNMFGSESAKYDFNSSAEIKGTVLPESSRTFTDIVDIKGFGRYTVEADIAFTQGGEVTRVTQTFWVIPVWLIIAFIAVILLIGFAGYMVYRRFSK